MVKATHGKTVTISQKAEIFDLRIIVHIASVPWHDHGLCFFVVLF